MPELETLDDAFDARERSPLVVANARRKEVMTAAVEWWFKKRDTDPFKKALAAFDALSGSREAKDATLSSIVAACYFAAHYDQAHDPYERKRAEIAGSKAKLSELRNAIHRLARACKGHDAVLDAAMTSAEYACGIRITRNVKDGPAHPMDVAARYFASLENALDGRFSELDGKGKLHQVCIGNLLFRTPVIAGGQNHVGPKTMLAFELELRLRRLSLGQGAESLQRGERMPGGRPNRHVVAAWIRAALPGDPDEQPVDSESVRSLIRNLPANTEYIGFPLDR
ncbi:hypothetical protein E4K72_03005 [Oxalobacteraceae bacterium OM1]|nr:hypothetical protein E4K72_03005 [Oxalobacteraceae bacterium OM1]